MKIRRIVVFLALFLLPAWSMASTISNDPNIIHMPTVIMEPGSEPRSSLDCIFLHSEKLLEYASKPNDKKFSYGIGLVRENMSEVAARNTEEYKERFMSDEQLMDDYFMVAFSNFAERCIRELEH